MGPHSRRQFLYTASGILLASCAGEPRPETDGAPVWWTPKVSENIGNLDEGTLRWMAQLGLEWVVLQGTDWVDRGAKGYWTADDIRPLQERCRAHGLELYSLMIPIAWLMGPMLGRDDRDESIANIQRSIEAAAGAGVRMFEWRWSPDFNFSGDTGYYTVDGRGGAGYKAFDFSRVADAPPFEDIGRISRQELWDRMAYFAERVVPVAEKAGAVMGCHPKDPPVQAMRGIERLLTNTDQIEQYLDVVDSPAHGFTFCQGTVTEMGVDVLDAIRRVGKRIHHVHFRTVRGAVPKFVETFIDDGDVDMLQAMRAYHEVGYQGSLVSDHTPRVVGDFAGGRVGRTYSHGYIRGLVQAVNAGPQPNANPGHRLKLAKGLRDLSDDTLAFFKQLGIEHVTMPTRFNLESSKRGLIPGTDNGPSNDEPLEPWKAAELKRIKDYLGERGLSAEMVHLGAFRRILLGKPDRDRELANVQESIRAAGEAGIPVVEYNSTPLRGSEGYGRTTGRGGSGLRDYDHARTKDLPPLPNVGEHSREEMWERLEWFLKAVIPVAEENNVRLAMHPNDPPVPVFRGAAQPVRSLEDQRRLIELVDSPANGITLDTGVTTEMGEDAAEAIRYFGSRDRIHHVHFRNVRVETPYYKYTEVMHDEGDCDMLACMRAFQEVGYRYLLIPDHTPEFTDDTLGNQVGWAFAIGYMQSLRHAAEASSQ